MNKEKFLKELEKKLAILNETERKDTINEYRDIIEEKVKHGKTEEEAVKEFGSINELAKEILEAYKINPNYKKTEAKDIVDNAEEIIKKGAKKISEVTDDVVDSIKKTDFDFNTENVFEIVIRIILLLVLLAVLKIPFYIISHLGIGIFNIGFEPFSSIFGFGWKFLIEIIYIGVCILLIIKVVTDYINKNSGKKKSYIHEKKSNKEKTVKQDDIVNEDKKKEKKNKPVRTGDSALVIILKIFIILIFVLPLFFVSLVLLVFIIILIFLIIKGIGVYGFLIFLIGCFGLVVSIIGLFYKGIISNKKIYIFPFVINFILIIVGGLISVDYILGFTYYDYLPENNFDIKTETNEVIIDKSITFDNNNVEYVIDNTLEDGKLKIESMYYNDFISDVNLKKDSEYNSIYYDYIYNNREFSLNNKYTKEFLNNIKNRKIYNYSLYDVVKTKIYVNEKTKNLVND